MSNKSKKYKLFPNCCLTEERILCTRRRFTQRFEEAVAAENAANAANAAAAVAARGLENGIAQGEESDSLSAITTTSISTMQSGDSTVYPTSTDVGDEGQQFDATLAHHRQPSVPKQINLDEGQLRFNGPLFVPAPFPPTSSSSSSAMPDILQDSPPELASDQHRHLPSQDPPEIPQGHVNEAPTSPPPSSPPPNSPPPNSPPQPLLPSQGQQTITEADFTVAKTLMIMRASPGPSTPVRPFSQGM